jgi:hypothetical protein
MYTFASLYKIIRSNRFMFEPFLVTFSLYCSVHILKLKAGDCLVTSIIIARGHKIPKDNYV